MKLERVIRWSIFLAPAVIFVGWVITLLLVCNVDQMDKISCSTQTVQTIATYLAPGGGGAMTLIFYLVASLTALFLRKWRHLGVAIGLFALVFIFRSIVEAFLPYSP